VEACEAAAINFRHVRIRGTFFNKQHSCETFHFLCKVWEEPNKGRVFDIGHLIGWSPVIEEDSDGPL
jgi:hypothetical protein